MTKLPAARDRTPAWPALAIAVLAVALRLWRVDHGLPDFLEEAIPFKEAFAMWGWETGRADLDPGFYNYPSLTLYLHLLVQKVHFALGLLLGAWAAPADYWLAYQIDATPQVVAARLVGVAADAATGLAVWRLGERWRRGAGVVAALLWSLAPTAIVTGRAIYTDSVMTALAAWALERMLVWHARGGRSRLAAAVVLVGLATGAKYTAGLLVLPLAGVLWSRDGRRGLALWPALAAAAVAVFLATSPWILRDFGAFWRDFGFERRHMAAGHLGTLDRTGALFHARLLARNLGLPALLLALGTLPALVRWRRTGGDATAPVLWLFLLPNLVGVATFRIEAARYLLPVLPAAAVLAGGVTVGLAVAARGRWPGRRGVLAGAVLCGLVIGPAAVAGPRAAFRGGEATQIQARRWLAAHLAPDELLVQEQYGPALATRYAVDEIRAHPAFARADTALQARFLARPTFRVVELPLAVSGAAEVAVAPPDGAVRRLTAWTHAAALNAAFYAPALHADVDWFVTSAAVRGRFAADPARYPDQVVFYALLEATADTVVAFRPDAVVAGPEIRIHRLDAASRRGMRAAAPQLDPLWWTRDVPTAFRREADALLAPGEGNAGAASRREDGNPAPWVRALSEIFAARVRPFLARLVWELVELGRCATAEPATDALLLMDPADAYAATMAAECALLAGDGEEARRIATATLARGGPETARTRLLRYQLARAHRNRGDTGAAIAVLEGLLADPETDAGLARTAHLALAALRNGPAPGGD